MIRKPLFMFFKSALNLQAEISVPDSVARPTDGPDRPDGELEACFGYTALVQEAVDNTLSCSFNDPNMRLACLRIAS